MFFHCDQTPGKPVLYNGEILLIPLLQLESELLFLFQLLLHTVLMQIVTLQVVIFLNKQETNRKKE